MNMKKKWLRFKSSRVEVSTKEGYSKQEYHSSIGLKQPKIQTTSLCPNFEKKKQTHKQPLFFENQKKQIAFETQVVVALTLTVKTKQFFLLF